MNYPYPKQTKIDNYNYGLDVCEQFFALNNLEFPKVKFANKLRYNSFGIANSSNIVTLNIKKCRTPVDNPGFSWSYTGYKADLTVAGVLAHECGHIVDFQLRMKSHQYFKKLKEIAITRPECEYNECEMVADAIRLYILNPDLLRLGRPERYKILSEKLGLKPVITDDWQTVLKNSHEKIRKAAITWIKKNEANLKFDHIDCSNL